ncbi:RNA-directed DNA polymerase, eukaryota [Tanacetum coccineum]
MSPIYAFPIKDMYTPEFSDSFQQNIGSIKEIAREDSPVEVTSLPPKTKRSRLEDAKRGQFKAMMHPDILHGQMRRKLRCLKVGFTYPKTTELVTRRRKLDFGVRLQESGATNEDYYARELADYEAKTGTTFKLFHCWKILKGSPKWMQSEVSKFAANINPNVDVGDDEEDEVQEIRRPIGRDKAKDVAKKKGLRALRSSSMNDEALARLMVSEMATQNEHAIEMQREERLAFLEIKTKEGRWDVVNKKFGTNQK